MTPPMAMPWPPIHLVIECMTMSAPSVERPAQIRRRERVVDQQRNAGGMGDIRDLRNVEHFQARIADGLADHEPGICSDGGADTVEVARLDEGGGDAEAWQRVGQEIDGAAVERRRSDDVIAGTQKRGDGEMHRRHAARGADGTDAVLQRRQPLLQHRGRRIGNARVDVAGALQIEQPGGMVGVVEHVGRCLIDRDRPCPGDWIGVLSRMQAQGLECWRFWCGHAILGRVKLCGLFISHGGSKGKGRRRCRRAL